MRSSCGRAPGSCRHDIRQPFPARTASASDLRDGERLDVLRSADAFPQRNRESRPDRRLWQYFAALAVSPLPHGGLIVILRPQLRGGSVMPARIPETCWNASREILRNARMCSACSTTARQQTFARLSV